jgi:hypothetical protein
MMIKTMEDYSLNMERNREVIKELRKRNAELVKALATSFEFLSFSQAADYWFYENHKHLISGVKYE